MRDNCCQLICDGDASCNLLLDGEPGIVERVSSYDSYEGSYEVTPKFEDQTLETREKIMRENVIVNAITISRVSNPAGGKTVYIGGQIDYV